MIIDRVVPGQVAERILARGETSALEESRVGECSGSGAFILGRVDRDVAWPHLANPVTTILTFRDQRLTDLWSSATSATDRFAAGNAQRKREQRDKAEKTARDHAEKATRFPHRYKPADAAT